MTTIGIPDPTDRTLQSLDQSVTNLQELIDHKLLASGVLSQEKLDSIRREIATNERHRLELKSDSEKTLNTATIAAEKAVQAALAAAEKARDQQTIASQLATTKAEEASKEQMKQQGETFSAAIAGLTMGFADVKSAVGELRAEARGTKDSSVTARAWAVMAVTIVLGIVSLIIAAVTTFGLR